jgi:signal peptidase I
MGAEFFRPALDAVAPAEPTSALRRVRTAAIWLAIAAWLFPSYAPLGTDSTERRALISAGFLATAILAFVLRRRDGAWKAVLAASGVAAALVAAASRGSFWGLGFTAFTAAVLFLTQARRRFPAPPPAFEHDPLPPTPGGVPALLTSLAWMGISVLVGIAFVGQATVVPTGSMEPTIMGAASGRFGDHVFVEEFSYVLRDPRRWEIVVFRFPLFRDILFVKRVVGLPGEHVEIRDGDVWIDGRIARKPRVVQSTMWQTLHPTATRKIVDDFQSSGPWRPETPTRLLASPKSAEPTFVLFTGKDTGPDLRVAFRALPRGDAAVAIARITSRGVPVTLSVPRAGSSKLEVGASAVEVNAVLGDGAPVELCVADREAWALVGGREVARVEMPEGVNRSPGAGSGRVEIGAAGAPIAFEEIRVARDIQYDARGVAAGWDVPADGFFFVGDHQAMSEDSRVWSVTVFHPPGGATPVAARPRVLTETGGDAPNVVRAAGLWSFRDVDGVRRSLPEEGTTLEQNVPMPFARRGDLVGRAVMVFFPFPPFGAFRPRLLP